MQSQFVFLVIALALLVLCCSAARKSTWGSCDPISPSHCGTPMPNNFYAVDDSGTSTGVRVNFTLDMLPKDGSGKPLNASVLRFNCRDGFSTGGPIVAILGETPKLTSNVPSWKTIGKSMDAQSSLTLLIDATTGALLPHWFEIDDRSLPFEGAHPPLMIYPASVLPNSHVIIVVLQGLVSIATGELIPPSAEFRALRDGLPSSDPSINDRRQSYNKIFALIASITGKSDRSAIQLAWEFTTESSTSQTKDVLSMRDDATARMPKDGPKYYFTEIDHSPKSDIFAYIFGLIEVPLYLNSPYPGGTFVIDPATQLPVFQGFTNVTFMLSVPRSLMNEPNNSRTGEFLQVGHGLFGNLTEIMYTPFPQVANEAKYLVGSVKWWGMCRDDDITVALMTLLDMSLFISISDRLSQSLVNHMYLTKAYMLGFSKDPIFNGRLNPAVAHYNGNSLGGIMGSVLLTVSQDIKKGVLGVGGSPFGVLMPRSVDYIPFWEAFVIRKYDITDRIVLTHIISFMLDHVMPNAYLGHLTSNPLPNTPLKHAIFQHGLSDSQVPHIGDEVSSRLANASIFAGTVHEDGEVLFGFRTLQSPVKFAKSEGGAVFQLWNFSMPLMPVVDVPQWPWYSTHGCTRRDPRAIKQLLHFFQFDEVVDFCGEGGCQRLSGTKCP